MFLVTLSNQLQVLQCRPQGFLTHGDCNNWFSPSIRLLNFTIQKNYVFFPIFYQITASVYLCESDMSFYKWNSQLQSICDDCTIFGSPPPPPISYMTINFQLFWIILRLGYANFWAERCDQDRRVRPRERFLDPPPTPLLSILYMTFFFKKLVYIFRVRLG